MLARGMARRAASLTLGDETTPVLTGIRTGRRFEQGWPSAGRGMTARTCKPARVCRTLWYMAKTERIEARAAPADVRRIEAAAWATSQSVSAFVVAAARAQADRVLAEQEETVVPNDYFERLLTELDKPPREIPALAAAVERAKRHPVISR
jgi:uncharacterized protein (DUF1778 family)